MNVHWSNHASMQLETQLDIVAFALCREDAARWRFKINEQTSILESMPAIGSRIPLMCFLDPPHDLDRLRQLIIRPYRVVYEVVGEQCRILAFVRCASLLTQGDVEWNG